MLSPSHESSRPQSVRQMACVPNHHRAYQCEPHQNKLLLQDVPDEFRFSPNPSSRTAVSLHSDPPSFHPPVRFLMFLRNRSYKSSRIPESSSILLQKRQQSTLLRQQPIRRLSAGSHGKNFYVLYGRQPPSKEIPTPVHRWRQSHPSPAKPHSKDRPLLPVGNCSPNE